MKYQEVRKIDINVITLTGRATKEPEIKSHSYKTRDGEQRTIKSARWNLAVKKMYKSSDTDADSVFLRCIANGKTADIVENYIHKGSKIGVTGRIDAYAYDSDGKQITVVEIVAEKVFLLESKNNDAPPGGSDSFMSIPKELEEEMPFN